MKTNDLLSQRRKNVESHRDKFDAGVLVDDPAVVSSEIYRSWGRCAKALTAPQEHAPIIDNHLALDLWEKSPLSVAALSEQSNLKQLVKEGPFIAVIADSFGRVLWSCSNNNMRERAERRNLVTGGLWREEDIGTNAIGLSLKLRRPVSVFAGEHFTGFLRESVCYASPIIHPTSGACVGTLNITALWRKHTPLAQSATMHIAQSIGQYLPEKAEQFELEVYALGQSRVMYCGKMINIPLRQMEILCILILNPHGLNLVQLYTALYGDESRSTATLKADVSHLRSRLGGGIGSRPYRLTLSFWADFVELWRTLKAEKESEAISLYRGCLLQASLSPEIEEWRHCIDAVVDQAINTCKSPIKLIEDISQDTGGSIMHRERILHLLSSS
jgi:hypothetical protein